MLTQLTVTSVDGGEIREYRVHFDTDLPQYSTIGGAIQGPNNTYDVDDDVDDVMMMMMCALQLECILLLVKQSF